MNILDTPAEERFDRITRIARLFDVPIALVSLVDAEVAQIQLSRFRESDLIARIGQDEFCILLMGLEFTWSDPALERVADLLEDLNVYRSAESQIAAAERPLT